MVGEIGGDEEERTAEYIARARHRSRSSPTSRASPRRPASAWATPARSSPAPPAPRRRRPRRSRRRACRWAATRPRRREHGRRAGSGAGLASADLPRYPRQPMPPPRPISFARGAPSARHHACRGAAGRPPTRRFDEDPAGALRMGRGSGYPALRDWIAERHGVEPEQVLVSNGSLEAGHHAVRPPGRRRRHGRGRGAVLRPHAAGAARARRRAVRRPARGRRHRRRRTGGGAGPRAPARASPHHPQLPQPGRLHALAGKRERLLELAASTTS